MTEAEGDVALQTDHRDAATLDAEWEISAIFASARALSVLLSQVVPAVRFVHPGPVPPRYATLVTQLGAALQPGASGPLLPAAPDVEAARATLEAAVLALGERVLAEHGANADIAGVRVVERAIQPKGAALRVEADNAPEFWTDVVRLGAVVAYTLHAAVGGRLDLATEWAGVFPLRWEVGDSLYNVFGRPEEFLERDPTFLPSDQLKLALQSPEVSRQVLWGLRRSDWPGAQVALCRPLCTGVAGEAQDNPVVALLEDMPETTQTLSRDTPIEAQRALEAEALANLGRIQVDAKTVDFGGSPLMVVQGHEYAAEKLLDPAFLAEAARQLGDSTLLAAVPQRGLLLLRPASGPGLPGYFGLVERSHGEAAVQARLSSAVFVVRDGVCVGWQEKPVAPEPKRGFWARLFGA